MGSPQKSDSVILAVVDQGVSCHTYYCSSFLNYYSDLYFQCIFVVLHLILDIVMLLMSVLVFVIVGRSKLYRSTVLLPLSSILVHVIGLSHGCFVNDFFCREHLSTHNHYPNCLLWLSSFGKLTFKT